MRENFTTFAIFHLPAALMDFAVCLQLESYLSRSWTLISCGSQYQFFLIRDTCEYTLKRHCNTTGLLRNSLNTRTYSFPLENQTSFPPFVDEALTPARRDVFPFFDFSVSKAPQSLVSRLFTLANTLSKHLTTSRTFVQSLGTSLERSRSRLKCAIGRLKGDQ